MIAYVGNPKKEELLWSKLYIRSFSLMLLPLFLGRAVGGLRLLWGGLSLREQLLPLGKLSLWIIYASVSS
jgi:hypothetical protein